MAERDAKGRFVKGNATSAAGGRARVARQTPAERAQIARLGLEAVALELGLTPEEAAQSAVGAGYRCPAAQVGGRSGGRRTDAGSGRRSILTLLGRPPMDPAVA